MLVTLSYYFIYPCNLYWVPGQLGYWTNWNFYQSRYKVTKWPDKLTGIIVTYVWYHNNTDFDFWRPWTDEMVFLQRCKKKQKTYREETTKFPFDIFHQRCALNNSANSLRIVPLIFIKNCLPSKTWKILQDVRPYPWYV